MEENAGDRVRAEARAKGRVDRIADEPALSEEVQEAHACVRNAGIVNPMSAECRACKNGVRSVAL